MNAQRTTWALNVLKMASPESTDRAFGEGWTEGHDWATRRDWAMTTFLMCPQPCITAGMAMNRHPDYSQEQIDAHLCGVDDGLGHEPFRLVLIARQRLKTALTEENPPIPKSVMRRLMKQTEP